MEYASQEAELSQLTQGQDAAWRQDLGREGAEVAPPPFPPPDVPEIAKSYLEAARAARASRAAPRWPPPLLGCAPIATGA